MELYRAVICVCVCVCVMVFFSKQYERQSIHIQYIHTIHITLMYHTALKMGTSLSQKFSKISSFLLNTGTYTYIHTIRYYS